MTAPGERTHMVSERRYTAEELSALRRAFPRSGIDDQRGPAYFAGGPYWPARLRRQAAEAERLAPRLRLAADALEREIAADPLTAAGVSEASR